MKMTLILACAVIALCLAVPPVQAQGAPNFQHGKHLFADAHPMLGGNLYSRPSVCDWNADGKKDIVVGMFYKGNVAVFLNHGTDADPAFGNGTILKADGAPISLTYG